MIPFPKMHIAESALNRILNTLEGTGPLSLTIMTPPVPPNPVALGAALDSQLSQQPASANVPPAAQEDVKAAMMESVLTGGSPFDGALVGALNSPEPPL